jgi:hypothetical protein
LIQNTASGETTVTVKLLELDDSQAPGFILEAKLHNGGQKPVMTPDYFESYYEVTATSDGSNPKAPKAGIDVPIFIVRSKRQHLANHDRIFEGSYAFSLAANEEPIRVLIYEGLGASVERDGPELGLWIQIQYHEKGNEREIQLFDALLYSYQETMILH